MDMLRQWRRRIFGVAAGAIIAPVAIVAAALAVGFGGGGIGALGSLGQAFNGPTLPTAAPLAGTGDARDQGRLLARVRRSSTVPAIFTTLATTVASTPVDATTDGEQTDGSTPVDTGFDPDGGAVPVGPQPTVAPVASPAPTAVPEPEPTTVARQVGETVRSVTDQLPAVGEPAGEIVDTLVDSVDTLLPR